MAIVIYIYSTADDTAIDRKPSPTKERDLELSADFGCALIYPREVLDANQSGTTATGRLRGTNHAPSKA